MRSTLIAAGLLAATLASTPALADGDTAAGHKVALQCQACHGMDGIAKIPEAANLAGQSEVYLTSALNDYKSGARKNDMMSTIAPTLSDSDIANVAAYYSAIEITAKIPGK